MELSTIQNITTMNTLEIAKLTGKEHKNILRDIKQIVHELPQLNFELGSFLDKQGQERPMYTLDKKASLLLVSGYNIKLRHAIIDRWDELETKQLKLAKEENIMLKQKLTEKAAEEPKVISTNKLTNSVAVHRIRRHYAELGKCDHNINPSVRHRFPLTVDGELDGFLADKNGQLDVFNIPEDQLDETVLALLYNLMKDAQRS